MSQHKVEEKVTQYASGDVTKEIKVDGHHVATEHNLVGHPQTKQHVEVREDGKKVAEREKVIDHYGHGHATDTTGVHVVGGAPVPATYVDKSGGAHPVVEAYQEGTKHGHEYHERVDVVNPDHHKHDKIKIKGHGGVPVVEQGHITTTLPSGPTVQKDTTVVSDRHGGIIKEEKVTVKDHGVQKEVKIHEIEHGKAPHPHEHHAKVKDHHGKGVEVHDNPHAHHGATQVIDPRAISGAHTTTTYDPHHAPTVVVDQHGKHHVVGTTTPTVDPHHAVVGNTTVAPTIVDQHGKHHVVGPTGGIVGTSGRETSNIVDMAKQVSHGEIPPNAQVKAELQPLQQHLLEKEKTASNPETEEAMHHTRKLVEAVEEAIDTKNSGDKFQRLIEAASRVAARTNPTSNTTALAKETIEFVELVKELVIELGRSKAFRKALLDLFTLMKDILSEEVNVDGNTAAHVAFVEGETKTVGKHIKDKTTTAITQMPEHHKRDISAQLKNLLLELRDHRESALAIQKTMRLGGLLNKELSFHINRAQADPDVREVIDLSIAIVQSFALGVDLRTYLIHLERAIEFIQNEVIIQQYLAECASFINRTIEHPEHIDSDIYVQEAEALVRKGRALAQLAKEHPIIMQVMDEASALVYAIKTDEQLNDIKYHAGKIADSMTYTDTEGKTRINFDVISVMRSELVPFLIERIREVQVPGFRIENEGKFQYLEVHDLYVTLGDILPDRIRIKTTNDTDLTLENLHSPLTSNSYVKFQMEGLRPEFKDFFFSFKRTGKVIKLKDEGRADLKIKGKGVNIFITFELEMDSEHRAMLGKHKVDLEMGPIDLDITQAEHKKMLNLASSLFAPKIKQAVETSLKSKLEEIGGEWATILNKRVLQAIPSISSIGTNVKQILTPTTTTHVDGKSTTTTHHPHTHPEGTSSTPAHISTTVPATGETHAHVHT